MRVGITQETHVLSGSCGVEYTINDTSPVSVLTSIFYIVILLVLMGVFCGGGGGGGGGGGCGSFLAGAATGAMASSYYRINRRYGGGRSYSSRGCGQTRVR